LAHILSLKHTHHKRIVAIEKCLKASQKRRKSPWHVRLYQFFLLFVNAFRRFFVSASDLQMSAKYVFIFFRSVAVFDDLFIMGGDGVL